MSIKYTETIVAPTMNQAREERKEREKWLCDMGIDYNVDHDIVHVESLVPIRIWQFNTEKDRTLFILRWGR
jgi:hypothetical protein